jgi:hypothetical protein
MHACFLLPVLGLAQRLNIGAKCLKLGFERQGARLHQPRCSLKGAGPIVSTRLRLCFISVVNKAAPPRRHLVGAVLDQDHVVDIAIGINHGHALRCHCRFPSPR